MLRRLLLTCSLVSVLAAPAVSHAPDLDARIAALLPTSEENRFLQVPWRINLMQARVESQQTGKPIFLWIMVGNPQGCT